MDPYTKFIIQHFQRLQGLDPDGVIGPKTRDAVRLLDRAMRPSVAEVRAAIGKTLAWPVSPWNPGGLDGPWMPPRVTSDHMTVNKDRPTHYGIDIFYPYHESMGDVTVGDGGAAGSKGKPKWYLPKETPIYPVAPGTVVYASQTKTGGLVWVRHRLPVGRVTVEWFSGYFHLSAILVAVGDEVSITSWLGHPGDNPNDNDAIHLHLEGYYDPDAVSPVVKYRSSATFSLTPHLRDF